MSELFSASFPEKQGKYREMVDFSAKQSVFHAEKWQFMWVVGRISLNCKQGIFSRVSGTLFAQTRNTFDRIYRNAPSGNA